MRLAITMLLAVLVATGAGEAAQAKGFKPEADKEQVALCSIVYPALRTRAAGLIDPQERTRMVLTAYRGEKRLAPYVDAVIKAIGAEAFEDQQAGNGMLVGLIVGNDSGDGQIPPAVREARLLNGLALACEGQLNDWKAPAFASEPEGMASGPNGPVAEYRVGDKSAGDVFANPGDAALVRAACEGDTAAVARQLAGGANPNAIGYEGITPLLWTVRCESLPGLEALLAGGSDPNLASTAGFSPVFAAASMRNSAILKLLLSRGGNPNAADADGESALTQAMHLAIFTDDHSNFEALVEAGADINRADDFDRTIAIDAALLNQFDIVLYLLEHGYTHNYRRLGFYIQRLPNDPKLTPKGERERAKAVEALRARGVTFPVNREDAGFASESDSAD